MSPCKTTRVLAEALPHPSTFLQTEGLFLGNQSGLPGGGLFVEDVMAIIDTPGSPK